MGVGDGEGGGVGVGVGVGVGLGDGQPSSPHGVGVRVSFSTPRLPASTRSGLRPNPGRASKAAPFPFVVLPPLEIAKGGLPAIPNCGWFAVHMCRKPRDPSTPLRAGCGAPLFSSSPKPAAIHRNSPPDSRSLYRQTNLRSSCHSGLLHVDASLFFKVLNSA